MLVDMGIDTVDNRSRSVSAISRKRRRAALTAIWERMRRLDDDQRQLVMSAIRSIVADTDGHVDRGRAMTEQEVRSLASDGLVSIGAHTVSHPLLTALGDVACGREIAKSKSDCEDLIGSQVNGFAYPYGEFDANARSAVSTARFTFACSTRHAAASSTSDIFALPRVQICNWDGDSFQRVLHRWSAGD
jgi:peptidoglycan/xylan/chitin deacetylase (PgdA/CDA1 family)